MKRILAVVVILALIGGAFTVGLLNPLGIGNAAAEGSSAELPPVPPPGSVTSIAFSTGERVVNLADPAGFRYLKTEVVLELGLSAEEAARLTPGEAYEKKLESIEEELAPEMHAINDMVTSVLSSRSSDELMSPEGKEALRAELKERLAGVLYRYPIRNIYLPTFIIQ